MDLDSYRNVLFKPTWSLQQDKKFWNGKLKETKAFASNR